MDTIILDELAFLPVKITSSIWEGPPPARWQTGKLDKSIRRGVADKGFFQSTRGVSVSLFGIVSYNIFFVKGQFVRSLSSKSG